ncbi:MAG TPA: class I SAM-dependent methyltransferase [Actinopolymorphaceae bacterium]
MSDEVRERWNGLAASFDESPDHGLRDPSVRRAWADLLLSVLPPAPADVLDLGCGTGTLSVLLAESGYRVAGVDLAEQMVAAARAKAATAGVDVRIDQGDAAAPPHPPRSFDVVLCRHVLWALPDPAAALERWADLLRPQGRLVLIEGSWATGAGLGAAECERLVRGLGRSTRLRRLDDPAYWGGETTDERYALVSPA